VLTSHRDAALVIAGIRARHAELLETTAAAGTPVEAG
jgi:hypothetical protein